MRRDTNTQVDDHALSTEQPRSTWEMWEESDDDLPPHPRQRAVKHAQRKRAGRHRTHRQHDDWKE